MGLLLEEGYEILKNKGVKFEEDRNKRFLVFEDFELPTGLYTVDKCSVLVFIPESYNDAGIDCLWFYPRLERADGVPIPQTSNSGANENHHHNDKEFFRWSRHWTGGNSWKKGVDNVATILRSIEWAVRNPDADR